MIAMHAGSCDLGRAGNIGASGIVGLVLPLVAGFIKKKFAGDNRA